MGFRQIFATGSFALEKIRNRIQAQSVHAHLQPKIHRFEHRLFDHRIGKIQIGLMGIKAMPVISLGHRVPRPVGGLKVFKDDARLFVLLLVFAPDVVIALLAAGRRPSRPLKPRVLIRCMIEHELGNHAQAASVRLG